MKRILIASRKPSCLHQLDDVLRRWGYRTLVTSSREEAGRMIAATAPDLFMLEAGWLRDNLSTLAPLVAYLRQHETLHTAIIDDLSGELPPLPEDLDQRRLAADLFSVYTLTQSLLQNHPRRRLRATVSLASMLRRTGERWEVAEVSSLGTGGMFIRSRRILQPLDEIQCFIALQGAQTEIQVCGRVRYAVAPSPRNRYLSGYGVEFATLDNDLGLTLKQYVTQCLLRDLDISPANLLPLLGALPATASA